MKIVSLQIFEQDDAEADQRNCTVCTFGKSKTTKLLKEMCQKGVITVEGKGKGTKYIIS